MNKHCISCGKEIEQARLDATQQKAKTCISCMQGKDVARVAGMPMITGKTSYSAIQLMSQEQAQKLYSLSDRRGQSPSKGVKFNKSAKQGSNQL